MWKMRVSVSGCHSDSPGTTAAPVGSKPIGVAIDAVSYGKWRVQLSCARLTTPTGKHHADDSRFGKNAESSGGFLTLYTKV